MRAASARTVVRFAEPWDLLAAKKERKRHLDRIRYLKNPSYYKQKSREWKTKNREKELQRKRDWYQKNKERCREYHRRYWALNPERQEYIKRKNREYYQRDKRKNNSRSDTSSRREQALPAQEHQAL